ncbi:MAG: ATP-binding protein, partial [Armatimonadetes bacterium]|nr:ATP-binding protein [Armatimonadota bacterium]
RPLLQLPLDAAEDDLESAQVKTIPGHFRAAHRAGDEDVARVFGSEDGAGRWHVGRPLDMETPVCLDLARFVERSNGIFGKTGTGKTFLTRLVLAGLLLKCPRDVVSLVFDMHNEYGNAARQEGSTAQVPGLRQLFPERVAIYTLDRESTQRRGGKWDGELQLGYDDLEPADLYAMREELGLSEPGCDTVALLEGQFDRDWLAKLLACDDLKDLAERIGAHEGALRAVRRKLQRLTKLSFLHPTIPESARHAVREIVKRLTDERQHVVLEFGNVTSLLGYLLVANVLTRKLHAEWVLRSEQYHATQQAADRPPQLIIAVEEAHKFLNPEAARQTSFGSIARELRKYFVSLLIIDQRPSGIDEEIRSQLGTRITAQLSDERDIDAVLAGTSNASGLRTVLAGLDSKQQALVFGHAVPMPVVLRTRPYDEGVATVRRQIAEDTQGVMGGDVRTSLW